MVHVIIYDISDDTRRYRISKYLEGKGQRIQESAFECRLGDDELNEVVDRLRHLMQNDGNIRIYPVCRSCIEKSIGIGSVQDIVGSKGYAIF